jgi:NAD(P)-dependent dehydrogenase (short-subunit alcohol dehydrogenase family)
MLDILKGQRVLIIGGSSGIGFAPAKEAIGAGAIVTIAAHDKRSLDAAAAELGAADVSTRTVDTLDNASVERLFEEAGAFRHVVVTAAWTRVGSIRDLSLEDGYKSMDSKFWGAYRVARAAKLESGGSLTLISGVLSRRPDPKAVLQGAINAAVEALVCGLAIEFAPIRVNAISPGLVDTPLYAGMDAEKRKDMLEKAARELPARRVGQASDIAQAILLTATNPYITGATILVDGGTSIA